MLPIARISHRLCTRFLQSLTSDSRNTHSDHGNTHSDHGNTHSDHGNTHNNQGNTPTADSRKAETYLVDYLELELQGGKGGDGCVSHLHMLRDRTKPVGGDGGKGGDIIIKSSLAKRDFSHIPSVLHAGSGGKGLSDRRGPGGNNTVIHVPIGTMIGSLVKQQPIAELRQENDMYLAAHGGKGGMGNKAIFRLQQNRNNYYRCIEFEWGHPGEINELFLEMKIIADIGLVGLPNAGKSSLLRAISSAKPKVASYPFTTLRPHVGVIHYEGFNRVQMADIPGLIEGSSLGYGLGISFLKHIERCEHLLYVIDMSNSDHDPIATVQILEKELDSFNTDMSKRILGIVANKLDLLKSSASIVTLAKTFPQYPVIPISALNQRNISSVRSLLEPLKTPHIDD